MKMAGYGHAKLWPKDGHFGHIFLDMIFKLALPNIWINIDAQTDL